MKSLFLVVMLIIATTYESIAQSTTAGIPGNTWAANKYLGYDLSNGLNPLYTKTNNINRMRLNGTQTEVISGVTKNTAGFLGLSPDGFFSTNSPWAMLHLEGPNNTPFTGGQWRTWMNTGLFMRENSDGMYVGLKQEAGTNRSDAVVSWSDDAPIDRLRFLFTTTALNGNGDNGSPLHGSSLSGYEFMRMEANGLLNEVNFQSGQVAIGPLTSPQNRLHMNAESALPNFLQISNSNKVVGATPTNGYGTGAIGTDGIKLGIQPVFTNQAARQTAFLQWQENTPFIIQTDWNNVSGDVINGERMRITSVGSVINTQGPNYLGITSPTNTTRIAISHNGTTPVTRPMSLVHLGYNTGLNSFIATTDGWRSWMDIGTFTSNGTDHTYVGLKSEGADRSDAVINWVDNQVAGSTPNGPDKLRFIFTSTTTALPPGEGDPVSQSQNGLETMRIVPFKDTTYTDTDSLTTYGG